MGQQDIDWQRVLGPVWKVVDALGPLEIESLENSLFDHATRAIRRHAVAEWQTPFPTHPVPWFAGGSYLSNDVRPGAWLQHAAGDYYIQDAGSMLALALCEVEPGQTVVDTCAAPGGKSSAILEQLRGKGCLVANEVISSRLAQLQVCLERTGLANFMVMNHEVDSLATILTDGNASRPADCVLVDAPCSGQSMLAKGKQSVSAFSSKQVAHNAARQNKLIAQASQMVKPGGRLVYSTCTFSFAENEAVVQNFLEASPAWELIRVPHLQSWELEGWPGCYRLWPQRDGCAGAFAAALRCNGENEMVHLDARSGQPGTQHQSGTRSPRWRPVSCDSIEEHLRIASADGQLFCKQWTLKKRKKSGPAGSDMQELHHFPAKVEESWIQAASAGSRWAERSLTARSESNWEPRYASGKLLGFGQEFAEQVCIDLEDEQAQRYVGGEAIRLESDLNGWVRVQWRGRALGWGKLVGNQLKNHFPKNLRQSVQAY